MSAARLTLALESGAVHLPATGTISVFRPPAAADLSALPGARVRVVTGFRPDHDAWAARGYAVAIASEGEHAGAVVFLPRSKALARALIAEAARPGGPVIVDGQKTDGIDSLIREMRGRAGLSAPFAKAHGKCVLVEAAPEAFADWALPPILRQPSGWVTAPGLFSADGPDAGSRALAAALPDKMPGRVADLGAGWGYLAFQVLERRGVTECALVEAEHSALEAARANIADDRAQFIWADATSWGGRGYDHVVMNPPFHPGRAPDPALGQAFIHAAARVLAPHGTLWMVANRHLPYEATLAETFRERRELPGPPAFKLVAARKPAGSRR